LKTVKQVNEHLVPKLVAMDLARQAVLSGDDIHVSNTTFVERGIREKPSSRAAKPAGDISSPTVRVKPRT
jgi:hypothetical protein